MALRASRRARPNSRLGFDTGLAAHAIEETGDYNYALRRKSGGDKLKLKKYCPRERKHTPHKESRKK